MAARNWIVFAHLGFEDVAAVVAILKMAIAFRDGRRRYGAPCARMERLYQAMGRCRAAAPGEFFERYLKGGENSVNAKKILLNGILHENPTFRLVLGMCPTLAITYQAANGVAMGLATTFVLVFSNLVISLLRRMIPEQIRIPAFVIVIATFVTVVEMVMHAFFPDLYDTLGVFISLIVVNCIIFRARGILCLQKPALWPPCWMGWAWAWALRWPSRC